MSEQTSAIHVLLIGIDYYKQPNRQGNYGICKGKPIPNLRPLLSINDPNAPRQIVDRLIHLANVTRAATVVVIPDKSGSLSK